MNIQELLKELSNDFFLYTNDEEIQSMLGFQLLDETELKKRDFSKPAASEDQINETEKRLGVRLPSSYREFLLLSNGFSRISPHIDNILPIEKVDFIYDTDREWVAMQQGDYWEDEITDEEYLQYETDVEQPFRPAYLKKSLKICDWSDGTVVALNPEIMHEGEWEVINFANWNIGATRYRSFYEFLLTVHRNNQEFSNED